MRIVTSPPLPGTCEAIPQAHSAFTGSGTTGCAAVLEGFRFVGIEREAEYVEIATKRIAHWRTQTSDPDLFGEAA